MKFRSLNFSILAALALTTSVIAARADTCSPATVQQVKSSLPTEKPVRISCDLVLAPTDVIRVPIAISGSKASGTVIDCNGATLDGTGFKKDTLAISSIRRPDGSWDAPSNVAIRNCTIKGNLRIVGMARNGQGAWLKHSSITEGHTQRAQEAAPSNIQVSDVTFEAEGQTPLYAGPGTTKLTVLRANFQGSTGGVAIYLDAESAGNTIEASTFAVKTKNREQIAVDASANNRIAGNTFDSPTNGGVFLYRNCGEGGTIRHQAPQNNVIFANTFSYKDARGARPAVWLGSRQGDSRYCFNDPAYPFGSSLSSRDFAQHNSVTDNMLPGGSPSLIVNNDAYNQVSGNR